MNCGERHARRRTLLFWNGPFCALCDRLIAVPDRTLDHIVPRMFGGNDSLSNLQLAHYPCNHERGHRKIRRNRRRRLIDPAASYFTDDGTVLVLRRGCVL